MEPNAEQQGACSDQGCRVQETGKCALNKALSECTFYSGLKSGSSDVAQHNGAQSVQQLAKSQIEDVLPELQPRSFHSGRELGRIDSPPFTCASYSKLIALFGQYEVGKTTFLISLYLKAIHGLLPSNYLFAGSLTLRAFEQRVRRIRDWKGDAANTFPVDHTRVKDPRQPALLHLALKRDDIRHDLLLTDYPGEWTERVAQTKTFADKLNFLKQAHGALFVLDGLQFSNDAERHAEAETSMMVLDRLVKDIKLEPASTPLAILVTKSDLIDMKIPESAQQVANHAIELGFPTILISLASFSRNRSLAEHGTGVSDALEHLLAFEPPGSNSFKSPIPNTRRAFHRFRA